MVLSVVSLILVHRAFSASFRRAIDGETPLSLWPVLLVVVAALTIVLLCPAASTLFRFGALHADDLLLVAAAVVGAFFALELLKPL